MRTVRGRHGCSCRYRHNHSRRLDVTCFLGAPKRCDTGIAVDVDMATAVSISTAICIAVAVDIDTAVSISTAISTAVAVDIETAVAVDIVITYLLGAPRR